MQKLFIIILILFLNWSGFGESAIKTWIPNTSYNEPTNWLGHKLPCSTSKIIFPEDLKTAVYLPKSVVIKEIELPADGELIMKPDSVIDFVDMEDFSCDRKEVMFKKINIEPWFKPSNWKSNSKQNIATPHTERIPCTYDDVIFPEQASFWVQYPEFPISVNSFTIEGTNVSDEKLQQFFNSEPGRRQFKNFDYQYRTNIISVKQMSCADKSGCLCQNYGFIEKAVCKNLQQVCRVTHCLNPIKPNGHCCEICGAFLNLNFDKNFFNLEKFRKSIMVYIRDSGYENINTYISKMLKNNEKYIQIVILENNFNYNGDSVNIAEYLHTHLLSNLKKYKLKSSELFVSGPEYYPGQHLKTTVRIMFGSLIFVLVILVIIYLFYGTEYNKKFNLPFNLPNFRPFIFVRFENSRDNDGGLEFRNRSVAQSLFNLDRAFDNPLYDEQQSTSTNETKVERAEKNETVFKNLLYSELQKTDISDEE